MSIINNMRKAIFSVSHSNQRQANLPPRPDETNYSHSCDCPPSITIASFWGRDDYISASDWIEMYDAITTDYNYTSANKIIRLGGHLRKYALSWYVEEMKGHDGELQDSNWYELKDSFKKHFIMCNLISQSSNVSSALSSYGG